MQSVLNFTGLICVFRKVRNKCRIQFLYSQLVLLFTEVEISFQWNGEKIFSALLTQQKLHFFLTVKIETLTLFVQVGKLLFDQRSLTVDLKQQISKL